MISYFISATGGNQAHLARVLGMARKPAAVLLACGREGRNLLVRHFRKKDRTEPNKLGGDRTHYWRQVADSVQNPALEGERAVNVDVSEPTFGHKVTGGTIRAKRGKALTIPVAPEAHGRRAAVLEHELGIKLFVWGREFGSGLLAGMVGQKLKVFYVLRASVYQRPDPTAWPPQAELDAAIHARADAVLQRQLDQSGRIA